MVRTRLVEVPRAEAEVSEGVTRRAQQRAVCRKRLDAGVEVDIDPDDRRPLQYIADGDRRLIKDHQPAR